MTSQIRLDPSLTPITADQKPLFDHTFSLLKQPISDYTFAGTYMWSAALNLYWAIIEDHLCVFANTTGDLTMLIPPMPCTAPNAPRLRRAIDECFRIMDAYNTAAGVPHRSRIEYISDELLEYTRSADIAWLSASPIWHDYVYDTARMIDLAGGPYKSKRHARTRFHKAHPEAHFNTLTPSDIPECIALLQLWANRTNQHHTDELTDACMATNDLLARDVAATTLVLNHFTELGLVGMALREHNTLVGFTLGEPLSPSQCVILIEKTHPDYDGAPQAIFSEFCSQHWSQYPECNVGDDWGIPGLRYTKLSYKPTRLLSKYTLARPRPCPHN